MKKITAAFDGLKYKKVTRDYALDIAKKTHAHLIGMFMDDQLYTSYKVYDLIVKEGVLPDKLQKFDAMDKALRDESAADFEKACQDHKLEFSIHHDRNFAIQELKYESIYSDLLIIAASETMSHLTEKPPTRLIRDLLGDVQCPVLIVPKEYQPIDKLVMLYDGEPSSVYAIKMFSYLLPQLKHLETEVISINSKTTSLHLPDHKLMKEFMHRHFPGATYTVKAGWAEEEILKQLRKYPGNALVVLGAYRRNTVSRWFRESMADVLMKEIQMPLFIAHSR